MSHFLFSRWRQMSKWYVQEFLIMAINSQDVCCFMRQRRSGEGSSGCRCGRFKETSLSEVAHDERHRHQSDADANRSEELVDGVGQDECARPCCHLRANDRLAEAQFAQHGRHIDPAGETNDTDNSSQVYRIHIRRSLTGVFHLFKCFKLLSTTHKDVPGLVSLITLSELFKTMEKKKKERYNRTLYYKNSNKKIKWNKLRLTFKKIKLN